MLTFITIALSASTSLSCNAIEIISPVLFTKDDCKLNVENPHISSSILKRNEKAIKANVTSECIYPQQKVIFRIIIQKHSWFGFREVQTFVRPVSNPKPSPFNVTVKDAYITCTNSIRTQYRIVAHAYVWIGGHPYPSLFGQSEKPQYFNCGT